MTHTSCKAKKKKSLLEIMQRQMGGKKEQQTEQGFFTILHNQRECSFRQISQKEWKYSISPLGYLSVRIISFSLNAFLLWAVFWVNKEEPKQKKTKCVSLQSEK